MKKANAILILTVNVLTGVLVLLIVASLLASCGAKFKHEISGEAVVKHVISVDTEGLTQFFTDLCALDSTLPDAESVRACALENVDKFIEFVEGNKGSSDFVP